LGALVQVICYEFCHVLQGVVEKLIIQRTKVSNVDSVAFDKNVLWLDVPMSDLDAVDVLQGAGQTAKEAAKKRQPV
jgi:hypothetical protein